MVSHCTRAYVLLKVMIADTHFEKAEQPFLLRNVIARFRPGGFMAWLHAKVAKHAPAGYEDETGFHFGVKTASDASVQASDVRID